MKKEHLDKAKALISETSSALRKLAECSFLSKAPMTTVTAPALTINLETLRKMASE